MRLHNAIVQFFSVFLFIYFFFIANIEQVHLKARAQTGEHYNYICYGHIFFMTALNYCVLFWCELLLYIFHIIPDLYCSQRQQVEA